MTIITSIARTTALESCAITAQTLNLDESFFDGPLFHVMIRLPSDFLNCLNLAHIRQLSQVPDTP
jgi:hypothetical protein